MGRPKSTATVRKCQICRKVKPIEEFYSHRGRPLDKAYTCKPCSKKKRTVDAMRARGIEALKDEFARDQSLLDLKRRTITNLEDSDDHI